QPSGCTPVWQPQALSDFRSKHLYKDDHFFNCRQYFVFSPDVPSEPLNCRINKTNKDCMFVAWDKPESDGGSPITGYYIERKERNSLLWVKANDTVVRNTEYPCAGLIEGLEYTFRVCAINRAGQGKPSKKTDFVTARTPVGAFETNTYAPNIGISVLFSICSFVSLTVVLPLPLILWTSVRPAELTGPRSLLRSRPTSRNSMWTS
uniref:Fibronectin type-III domain-containing protein n=1 Tax=Mastacembelus armatus TaxID=205130 RepID=A0A7N9AMB4_9TELE